MRLTLNTMTAVAQAEYLHQQRSIDNRRHRWWVALPGQFMLRMSIFTVSFIFMILVGEALGLLQIRAIPANYRLLALILWVLIPGFTLLPTAFVLHFGLMLRTLLWTANSVPREKITGTWDLLLLTGASGSAIVYNKWWATVLRALPAYLRLAALRAGVLFWVLEWTRMRIEFSPNLVVEFTDYPAVNLGTLGMMLVLIFFFTLLNLLVTAAVGILAAFISKSGTVNTGLAAVLRSVILLLPLGALFLLSLFLAPYLYYTETGIDFFTLFTIVQLTAITLGENGMVLSFAATTFNFISTTSFREYIVALGSYGMPVLIYLLVLLLSLKSAVVLASRQGALKREKGKKIRQELSDKS